MNPAPAVGPTAGLTVSLLRRQIAAYLRAAWGAADDRAAVAALDARLLVAHAIGLPADRFMAAGDRPVTAAEAAAARALAARRATGAPVARLTGEKEFWSLSLRLGPDTLVPRPDTETVVAAVLEVLPAGHRNAPLRLLDLGTGSGAILLALLSELPQAFGIGIDRAFGAVCIAAANAARLGLGDRAAFVCGDWAGAIAGAADVVVANPPYIETDDLAALPAEVRDGDPLLALDGGADGLVAYRALASMLPRLLRPAGIAAFEVGAGQAAAVGGLLRAAGLPTAIRSDLAGRERVVLAGSAIAAAAK